GKHIVELKSNIQIDETLINTLDNDAMGVDVKGLIKLVKKIDFTDYKEFTIQDDTALTREEMIVLAMTVFEFEPITNPILDFLDSDKVSENAKGYIAKASELGIITGYKGNMLRPKQKISKAEIYTIVARCLNIK
ncbi:MAG: S-layer homology domain-containing protein, partial [Clostridia bacterium]